MFVGVHGSLGLLFHDSWSKFIFDFVKFNHKHLNIPMMARYAIAFAKLCLKMIVIAINVIIKYKPQCSFTQLITQLIMFIMILLH